MAVFRLETIAPVLPEEAWKLLGHWEDLSWIPGVSQVEATDDERVVTLDNGAVLREALLRRDDGDRTIVYSIVESPLGLAAHEATMSVAPKGLGCHVVVSVAVEPEEAIEGMQPFYAEALKNLTRILTA